MLIKYGDLDVTHRLLDYKASIAFADGHLIGNVPTMQLNLKFDNYDGILDNLDTNIYWEIQETDTTVERYFRVYDQPEKYTKTLNLKLYDNCYSLDIAYDTKLTYPATIKDQIGEMESLTGFYIIRTNIPDYILNKEVAWYDNTIVIRSYLGWIAELFGSNVFAKGKDSFEFVKVTKDIFASTDTLTNYEKNEVYKVTRIYAENGLNPLEKGDETGNTMFLDANNLYLDDQQIVDRLYSQFNGITFNSTKSIDMISIDNLMPGKLINYNDELNFMVIDLSNTFKGGGFLLSNVDGTVTTKNEERILKRINNTTRIRKLQIIQDQENNRLDIIAKKQENNDKEIGRLTVASDQITADIKNSTTVATESGYVTLKEYVEKMTVDMDGITNTLSTSSGNNLIRDSMGCFNDSWDGDYNLDSTPETRKRNSYGYALLLKKGSLKQQVPVAKGTYTLSFVYKKLINLAKASVVVNGEEFALSNNDFTEFKHSLEVTSNFITLEFVADTDNSCPIINLMLNKGDTKMEWSLNPNETWSDTVQIGRGIRISSSGTDVVFVANADIIGFMNKQGEYITTFDDEGLVANSIVVKNKATIVNLLIQDINGQTVINRINPEEVEVIANGK